MDRAAACARRTSRASPRTTTTAATEWGKGVAINYKKHGGESFPDTAGVLDIERGQLADIRPLFWQTDTSVSKTSWGYVRNHEYKTARTRSWTTSWTS